jgi:hypothetical protein
MDLEKELPVEFRLLQTSDSDAAKKLKKLTLLFDLFGAHDM